MQDLSAASWRLFQVLIVDSFAIIVAHFRSLAARLKIITTFTMMKLPL